MRINILKLAEYFTVFIIGGIVYNCCELLWRGYSHWTMTIAGGLSFIVIYIVTNRFPNRPMWLKCVQGCFIITGIEFVFGCVVNLLLNWHVWDYSGIPFNLLGQVCVLYMAIWFMMSIPAVLIGRFLKTKIFIDRRNIYDGEPKEEKI